LEDIQVKNLPFKKALLAVAMGAFSASAVADAGGTNWSLSGWINEGIIYYDDGGTSDINQTSDNGVTLGSRMTFAGSTDLSHGLSAGFEVILEPQDVATQPILTNQTALDTSTNLLGGVTTLGHNVHVAGGWGKLTVGLLSTPTDNIAVLADPSLTLWDSIAVLFRGNGFVTAGNPGSIGSYATCFGSGLGIGIDCNGIYRNAVRYDLPTFVEGLGIATSYANDDIYDVAGKWNGQLGRMTAILHMGYTVINSTDMGAPGVVSVYDSSDIFQLQAGLMDPVTGIFGTVAYQNESADAHPGAAINTPEDSDAYWIKVGVKKAFNTLGDTAIAFQYGSYNDQYGAVHVGNGVTGSELERIGFSINQYFGSRLIIYGAYENLDTDVDGPAATQALYVNADDLDIFTLGFTFFY
jgi:hypothetical protein